MSKSLGNGIDPLEVIEQFGADALRFMLMTGCTPGNDMRFKIEKLESSRNFANKLWNASRFVIMNLQDEEGNFREMSWDNLKDEDKWILSRVNDAAGYVTKTLEKFDLALAGQRVYETIWNEYCDWYIELVKSRLYGDDEEDKKTARGVLVKALKDQLRMLHPFMPFITEEIWSYLPKDSKEDNPEGFLIKESWPCFVEEKIYGEEAASIELSMEVIRAIRNIRAEAEAAPSRKLRAAIIANGDKSDKIKNGQRYIMNLANITDIEFIDDRAKAPEEVMSAEIDGATILIPLDDLLDYKAELERLSKEKSRLENEVKRVQAKLTNQGFISKAPENVISEEKEKQAKYEGMLEKVAARLAMVEKKL